MLTQEQLDEMLRRGFSTGQRSRFYGSDSSSGFQQPPRPPAEHNYVLKPIPTPGVKIDAQLRALQVLRSVMLNVQTGASYYFQGDRINIFELGLPQEPPLLTGKQCKVVETGVLQQGPLLRIPMFKISALPNNWIDAAYFGEQLPLVRVLRVPVPAT